MKVTTELKNLIKRSFDEKKHRIIDMSEESANKGYEEKLREVSASKEFKALAKAANAFCEKFEDDKSERYSSDGYPWYLKNFDFLQNIKAKCIYCNNVSSYSRYNEDIQYNTEQKIKELEIARESLLIKLTYEKDIETIRSMLADYDIAI